MTNKQRVKKLREWIAALESGDYTKGKGYLCYFHRGTAYYCCLGVAYELDWGEEAWKHGLDHYDETSHLKTHAGDAVDYRPQYLPGDVAVGYLIQCNDNEDSWDRVIKVLRNCIQKLQ